MSECLTDKVAIITGASRGIGFAVAQLFAQEGAKVIICSRHKNDIELAAAQLIKRTQNQHIYPFEADLSKEENIQDLFEFVSSSFGRLDILVNNAAMLTSGLIEDCVKNDIDALMNVNVTASILCSKYAFRLMKSKGGSIINVSSLSGIKGVEKFPGLSAYVASKFAVVGLTEALAVEGKPYQIRVNCIAPGAVKTKMLKKAFPEFIPSTEPEEIAPTFLFLANDNQSKRITGEIIEIHCNN